MHLPERTIMICFLLMVLSACLLSCEKPKQGKVVVSESNFYIERVTKTGFELCAKGKVKNVGEVDVKNVAVTGNCLSCTEVYKYDGSWVNPPDTGKSPEQQPVINSLPVGEEKEFIIKNIAYAPTQKDQSPKDIPKELEVVIVSFETASE